MLFSVFTRHVTVFVFLVALVIALASLASFYVVPENMAFGIVGFSILFSLGTILVSERGGFVRTRQMRRAYEPARHYNGFQVLALIILIMLQIGIVAHFFIT